jgi:DnaK suppressor protein
VTGTDAYHAALLDEFRARLAAARQELVSTVAAAEGELDTLEAPQAGAPVEDATTVAVADLLARLTGRERHALDEVDAAVNRLESGTYGLCLACGRPVGLARLRAVPATRHCVACQREGERGA